MTRYLVDARTVLVLTLAMTCAILLAFGSAVYGYRAHRKIHDAYRFMAQADSLQRDWVSRGCAPRTKALP